MNVIKIIAEEALHCLKALLFYALIHITILHPKVLWLL